MRFGTVKAFSSASLGIVMVLALLCGPSIARAAVPASLRLSGRDLLIHMPKISPTPQPGIVRADVKVGIDNVGARAFAVSASDFTLWAQGDAFAAVPASAEPARIDLGRRRSGTLDLSFRLPSAAWAYASLSYRPADRSVTGTVALGGSASTVAVGGPSSLAATATAPTINTFYASQGVGEPWGVALDRSGNVWFAEPGCDFAPTCPAQTRPGQIGELSASSHSVVFFTLPNIAGNQPIFLAFDGSGNLWFTTPNNSRIGEFRPSTKRFVGQWPVTAGSGPWDLTFAGGKIWYAEHLGAAIGMFNPAKHSHRDFRTPSAGSNPYGIVASGRLVWFTENNGNVDRIASLNTTTDAISEYPIVQPLSGTPHLITMDASGHPWWTEGFSDTIATLNPASATPGQCGTTSGVCTGVQRFPLPGVSTCSTSAHTSGIGFNLRTGLVWLDNSLTAQVGSFNPTSDAFALSTLSSCGAHPHDGLAIDSANNVWFSEEFGSAIGELIP